MARAAKAKAKPVALIPVTPEITEAYLKPKPHTPIETIPWPHTTPEQAKKEIAAIQKQYPFMAYLDALMLNVHRGCSEVSTRFKDTSGGGRYTRFCKQLRIKYNRTDIF